jgi:hypothetical protein
MSWVTKGRLISKCPFGFLKSPKKTNEFYLFLEARAEILEKNLLVFWEI